MVKGSASAKLGKSKTPSSRAIAVAFHQAPVGDLAPELENLGLRHLRRVAPAPGDPDIDFGTDGKVLTDFSGAGSDDEANAVVLAPGGKILAAGRSDNRFAIARSNRDGNLDTTFGSGGKVLTGFGAFSFEQISALALQPDGKIVAAGESTVGGSFDFALARYHSDGSLDTSFGSGGTVVTDFSVTEVSPDPLTGIVALVLEPDGQIVVAGGSAAGGSVDFALGRYQGR